jgi:hypothetical protein
VSWTETSRGIEVKIGTARKIYSSQVKRILLRDGGRRVIAQHMMGIMEIDLETGEDRKLFDPVPGLDFLNLSPSDRWLVGGRWSGGWQPLLIWDIQTGELKEISLGPQARGYFSQDSRLLAAVSSQGCWLLETGTWRVIRRLTAGGFPPRVAFSPDGRLLALRHPHRSVHLLRIDHLPGAGGHWLPDKALDLDVTPGDPLEVAVFESPDGKKIGALRFSPDGSQLSGLNRVWNLRNIRALLRECNLDWDLPPYPEEDRRRMVNIVAEE